MDSEEKIVAGPTNLRAKMSGTVRCQKIFPSSSGGKSFRCRGLDIMLEESERRPRIPVVMGATKERWRSVGRLSC